MIKTDIFKYCETDIFIQLYLCCDTEPILKFIFDKLIL